jgi:hypothetical protein
LITQGKSTEIYSDDMFGINVFLGVERKLKGERIGKSLDGVKILDFGTPKERITPGFVSLKGIYRLLRESLRLVYQTDDRDKARKVKITGNEAIDFDIKTSCGSSSWQNPCSSRDKRRLEKVVCVVEDNSRKYAVMELSNSIHENGVGGENVTHNFVLRDNLPVLMTVQHLSYDTSSNSDEDTGTSHTHKTELLEEKDPFARLVFEMIRALDKTGEI